MFVMNILNGSHDVMCAVTEAIVDLSSSPRFLVITHGSDAIVIVLSFVHSPQASEERYRCHESL